MDNIAKELVAVAKLLTAEELTLRVQQQREDWLVLELKGDSSGLDRSEMDKIAKSVSQKVTKVANKKGWELEKYTVVPAHSPTIWRVDYILNPTSATVEEFAKALKRIRP